MYFKNLLAWNPALYVEILMALLLLLATFCYSFDWAAIQVMQLFVEHVLLKHDFPSAFAYLNRLRIVSSNIFKCLHF